MVPKLVLGVIVAHGPELRSLVHSGLLEQLARHYAIIVWMRYPESRAVAQLSTYAEIRPLPARSNDSPFLAGVRSRFYSLYLRWWRRSGQRKWSHRLPGSESNRSRSLKALDPILAIGSTRQAIVLAAAMERFLIGRLGCAGWGETLSETKTAVLLTGSYFGPIVEPAINGAIRKRIPVFTALHSWKDAYVHPRLPVSLSGMFLWDEAGMEQMRQWNPFAHYDLWPVGSLHLAALRQITREMNRADFCSMNALDPARPYACYTMASPSSTNNEDVLIGEIAERLRKRSSTVQLLVRQNPMDNRRSYAFSGMENVVLQRPEWEWVPAINWCAPLPDDAVLWASTIVHSALNISIPSTVTTEFLAYGKPVVNVLFDWPSAMPERASNLRFWNSEYYRTLHNHPDVHPVRSMTELREEITALSGNGLLDGGLPHAGTIGDTVNSIAALMTSPSQ